MATEAARRRKAVALILSGVFPGLGQFYNRQPIKGALFLVAGAVLSWPVMRAMPTDVEALAQQGVTVVGPAALLLLAVWLWSVVDAWRLANRVRALRPPGR
jgi:hypothetical protein